MVTLERIEFGCVHKLYPLNRIVRTGSSYPVRSAITATAELLVFCILTLDGPFAFWLPVL